MLFTNQLYLLYHHRAQTTIFHYGLCDYRLLLLDNWFWFSLPYCHTYYMNFITGYDRPPFGNECTCTKMCSFINYIFNTPSSTICFFWHNLQNVVLLNECLYIRALTYSNLILWSCTVIKLITLIDQKDKFVKLWWDLKCKPIKLCSQRLELFLTPNYLSNCQPRLWTEHTSMLQVTFPSKQNIRDRVYFSN